MENYEINGIVVTGEKTVRYTACIANRFATYLDNQTAIECAIVIDAIGNGKIKDGEQTNVLTTVMNSSMSIDEVLNLIDSVRAPRKAREMSEKSKLKSKVIKLSKIPGVTSAGIGMLLGIGENEVNEIIKQHNKD